eukprot:Hpha_TRINITY_DN16223_c2_g1::TRINITY_DN16223_c2_g1_i1::g.13251::m.13251
MLQDRPELTGKWYEQQPRGVKRRLYERPRVLGTLPGGLRGKVLALEDLADDLLRSPKPGQLSFDLSFNKVQRSVADHDEAVRPPVGGGPLAVLAWELRKESAHRQQLSLEKFHSVILAHGTSKLPVSIEDAEEFLSVLFLLTHRRGGHTGWQIAVHQAVAQLAFRTIVGLFQPGRWFRIFRGALLNLLGSVGRTDEEFYKQAELPPEASWVGEAEQQNEGARGSEGTGGEELAAALANLARVEDELRDALLPPRRPPTRTLGFLRTLNAVDEGILSGLSEEFFQRVASCVAAVDGGTGRCSYESVKEIARTLGVPPPPSAEDGGSVSFSAMLRHWHPAVPPRFIDRRVRLWLVDTGRSAVSTSPPPHRPSGDEGEELPSPASAAGSNEVLSPDAQSAMSQELGDGLSPSCQTAPSDALATPSFGGGAAVELVCDDWQQGLRLSARVRVRPKASNLPEALQDVGITVEALADAYAVSGVDTGSDASCQGAEPGWVVWDVDAVSVRRPDEAEGAYGAAEGPTVVVTLRVPDLGAAISGLDLESLLSPRATPPDNVFRLVAAFEALDESQTGKVSVAELCKVMKSGEEQEEAAEEGEVSLQEALLRFCPEVGEEAVEEVAEAVAVQRREKVEAGHADEEAFSREEVLRRERPLQRISRLNAERSQCSAAVEAARAKARAQEEERRSPHAAETGAVKSEQPCCPTVHSCEPPPVVSVVAGLRLTADCFDLSSFLDDTLTRAAGVRLLETLDQAGINPHFVYHSPTRFLQSLMSHRQRVYRNVGICLPPPPLWDNQNQQASPLFFETNIPSGSGFRFRIHFEGCTWGMRTTPIPFSAALPGVRVSMRPYGSAPGARRRGLVRSRTVEGVIVNWEREERHGAASPRRKETFEPKAWWDSDAKCVAAGRTPTISTIVVGSCRRFLGPLGNFETMGWPSADGWKWDLVPGREGWDKETVRHMSRGLAEAESFYSYDSTVSVRLWAPGMIAGLTASVYVMGPEEVPSGFDLHGGFSYRSKDLMVVAWAAATAILSTVTCTYEEPESEFGDFDYN